MDGSTRDDERMVFIRVTSPKENARSHEKQEEERKFAREPTGGRYLQWLSQAAWIGPPVGWVVSGRGVSRCSFPSPPPAPGKERGSTTSTAAMVWFAILPDDESKIKVDDAKVNPEACQQRDAPPFEEQDDEAPATRKRERRKGKNVFLMISFVTETKERR